VRTVKTDGGLLPLIREVPGKGHNRRGMPSRQICRLSEGRREGGGNRCRLDEGGGGSGGSKQKEGGDSEGEGKKPFPHLI